MTSKSMAKPLLVALWEVRSYLRDKADLAFSLLLPVAIFGLMYGAFGGQSLFHGTLRVVNEDQGGSYATLLLERLGELDNLDVELLPAEKADIRLERSDLLMALYIPEGFSARLGSEEQARLVFKQRGNGGQEGQIVASLVRGVVEGIEQELQVRRRVGNALEGSSIPMDKVETTVEKFLEREKEHPIVGVSEETVGESPDMVRHFLPGIVTMFVLFAITLSARALVEERKKGTLERLLTTRLSVGQLFVGKFLASASRGFVQTLILLVLAYAVFQLFTPFTFVECLVVAIVFSAAVSTLGLIIGSVARTEDQAVWTSVFFTMAMVMLAGTFFAISEESALYALTKVSINTHANNAFKAIIARGDSLADLGSEMAVLAGVIVVGLPLSRVLFKVMPGGK